MSAKKKVTVGTGHGMVRFNLSGAGVQGCRGGDSHLAEFIHTPVSAAGGAGGAGAGGGGGAMHVVGVHSDTLRVFPSTVATIQLKPLTKPSVPTT
jgi:hypothetical protein